MTEDGVFSHSKIDRLGNRLRDSVTKEDLELLDRYRRAFRTDYEFVVNSLRDQLGLEVSGRPAKSTTAIIDKLQRGSMRLSQMQDIAGCRILVGDPMSQDELIGQITALFSSTVIDRRAQPSHGYRAVHVVACPLVRPIEIQIRTAYQHLWAELSEKLSDIFGIGIKYGIGDKNVLQDLILFSKAIEEYEQIGREMAVQVNSVNRSLQSQNTEELLQRFIASTDELKVFLFRFTTILEAKK